MQWRLRRTCLLQFVGRSTIHHNTIQLILRALWISQILYLQHFAVVFYHLIDSHRVELAVVGPVHIDIAGVYLLIGCFS